MKYDFMHCSAISVRQGRLKDEARLCTASPLECRNLAHSLNARMTRVFIAAELGVQESFRR